MLVKGSGNAVHACSISPRRTVCPNSAASDGADKHYGPVPEHDRHDRQQQKDPAVSVALIRILVGAMMV